MKAPTHQSHAGISELAGEDAEPKSIPGLRLSLPHDHQLNPAEWSALVRQFLTLMVEGKHACGPIDRGPG